MRSLRLSSSLRSLSSEKKKKQISILNCLRHLDSKLLRARNVSSPGGIFDCSKFKKSPAWRRTAVGMLRQYIARRVSRRSIPPSEILKCSSDRTLHIPLLSIVSTNEYVVATIVVVVVVLFQRSALSATAFLIKSPQGFIKIVRR